MHNHEAHGHHDYSHEAMGDILEQEGALHRGFNADAAAWLRGLPTVPVARVVDAGSGPGLAACVLAETFPDAEVIAVDAQDGLLARATARAERLGLGARFRTHRAEFPGGLDGLEPVDLAWSSRALHHVGDQQAAVDALAATLRPGGVLAVVEGGLPPRCLPRDLGLGTPGLEARVDAAAQDWFSHMRTDLPEATTAVEDWTGMIAKAGLAPAGTKTFLADLPAPLSAEDRRGVHTRLTMARDQLADALLPDDKATLETLLDPDSPHGVLHRRDVFFLHALTVHTGRKE
ncbi:class I SAM-dependent methyltransferase [Actinokineospora sp. PR83]|uniref:class I SAM-dependent methyltransferase n=1 Tax=Actinokineospora sp. PR83 TaxID=2884908 RepID=UPI001F1D37EF|nr:class I SAM-dependent methyltransferase [Actinokineospora sp. PR83]MCG8920362.1 class I SAM-dependent methyltransferase [Actinokineospora sp. PR83]